MSKQKKILKYSMVSILGRPIMGKVVTSNDLIKSMNQNKSDLGINLTIIGHFKLKKRHLKNLISNFITLLMEYMRDHSKKDYLILVTSSSENKLIKILLLVIMW